MVGFVTENIYDRYKYYLSKISTVQYCISHVFCSYAACLITKSKNDDQNQILSSNGIVTFVWIKFMTAILPFMFDTRGDVMRNCCTSVDSAD